MFLSVTPATLTADVKAVQTDDSFDRAALTYLQQHSVTDLNAIKADLKNPSASNQALLQAVQTAEQQYVAKLTGDVNQLLSATGLAEQSGRDGKALIKHASARRIAAVTDDIAALNGSFAGSLSDIRVDAQSAAVSNALAALLSANSSNGALASDAAKLNADNGIASSAIVADSQTYSFGLSNLANDLSTLLPAV